MRSFDPSPHDLRGQATRGLVFTVGAQVAKAALQLTSITILSRLLTPSDFGLFAMVAVFVNLIAVVKAGGLSVATIHASAITHQQVSNLFWINAALGLALALTTLVSAPAIAWIYDDPRLVPIAATMSIVFVLSGFVVQGEALVRRRMMFRKLALLDVVSRAGGVGLAIAAGFAGAGYWALVIGQVASEFLRAVMVQIVAGWRPGLYRRGAGVRQMVGLGVQVTGANVVGFIATNSVPFAIGLVAGPVSLGLYNRANAVTSIPSSQLVPPLMSVAQPAFARLGETPEALRAGILSVLGKLALGASFATAALFATADWTTALLLGPEWGAAVPYMRFLALFVLVEPLAALLATAMMAHGAGGLLLKSKIVTLIAIVAALAGGFWWGPIGIVAAVAGSGLVVRMPIFIAFAARALPVNMADIYRAILPPLAMSALMGGTIALLRLLVPDLSPLEGLSLTLPAGAVVFVILGMLYAPTRLHLNASFRLALSLARRQGRR